LKFGARLCLQLSIRQAVDYKRGKWIFLKFGQNSFHVRVVFGLGPLSGSGGEAEEEEKRRRNKTKT